MRIVIIALAFASSLHAQIVQVFSSKPVTFGWNASEDADGYRLYEGKLMLGAATTTRYTVEGFGVGPHAIRVSAFNDVAEVFSEPFEFNVVAVPSHPSVISLQRSFDLNEWRTIRTLAPIEPLRPGEFYRLTITPQ